MKKLNITWDGVKDTTGYLFSFAKALVALCHFMNSSSTDISRSSRLRLRGRVFCVSRM